MKLLLATLLLCSPFSESIWQCPGRPPVIFTIARREGFGKKGTLPTRLHNPGALKYCRQRGAQRGELGFARFANDKLGWAALERDVVGKYARHIPLSIGWDYL